MTISDMVTKTVEMIESNSKKMVHIIVPGFRLPFCLTKDNEAEIKETLSYIKDTLVIIYETCEVIRISDIFDYDINHTSA